MRVNTLFAAMGRLPSIEMFDNDYPTPDGTCQRDYVHVSDLAAAHVAAIEWVIAGNSSNSFNLGNGRGYSVAEVIRTTEQVTGSAVKADPPTKSWRSSNSNQRFNQGAQTPRMEAGVSGTPPANCRVPMVL